MHMFAAVLWDFDGTLVNTEPRWAQAEDTLLARYGLSLILSSEPTRRAQKACSVVCL